MKLGGNIELIGFESLEPGTLIVVKKMVGNYAKKIEGLERFVLTLNKNDEYKMECLLVINGEEHKAEVSNKNLFYGIDKAISEANK